MRDKFVQELMDLHYKFRGFLDKKDYTSTASLLNTYNEETDVNVLKTALIITRSFKDHEVVGPPRQRVLDLFERKMPAGDVIR
jgi:hypothetical protein